jgi:transcriptional regulator
LKGRVNMYVPKLFKVTDINEIKEFIHHHSFGTVISSKEGRPVATHIPLQIQEEADQLFLTGHFAYGNSQWRSLLGEEVLVIFQGPHSYISSSWYTTERVPTWNYQAVHIYGKAEILEREALVEDLKLLLEKYELGRDNAVLWHTLSPDLLEKELKGIVGFKIAVTEVQAAYKLSQNRSDIDFHKIIEQLQETQDLAAQQIAEEMKKVR